MEVLVTRNNKSITQITLIIYGWLKKQYFIKKYLFCSRSQICILIILQFIAYCKDTTLLSTPFTYILDPMFNVFTNWNIYIDWNYFCWMHRCHLANAGMLVCTSHCATNTGLGCEKNDLDGWIKPTQLKLHFFLPNSIICKLIGRWDMWQ